MLSRESIVLTNFQNDETNGQEDQDVLTDNQQEEINNKENITNISGL